MPGWTAGRGSARLLFVRERKPVRAVALPRGSMLARDPCDADDAGRRVDPEDGGRIVQVETRDLTDRGTAVGGARRRSRRWQRSADPSALRAVRQSMHGLEGCAGVIEDLRVLAYAAGGFHGLDEHHGAATR